MVGNQSNLVHATHNCLLIELHVFKTIAQKSRKVPKVLEKIDRFSFALSGDKEKFFV